ncbi:hypothetical protein HZ993_21655 [Rhodoferax sp. AJA081-3]|nr:hypothetical protein HZ993_21655 [Rhodoferax sp. AJA081-3]
MDQLTTKVGGGQLPYRGNGQRTAAGSQLAGPALERLANCICHQQCANEGGK